MVRWGSVWLTIALVLHDSIAPKAWFGNAEFESLAWFIGCVFVFDVVDSLIDVVQKVLGGK